MAVVLNAKGTSIQSFQIGKQGPIVKNSSGILEFRNAADSDFIEIKADSPTSNDGVATKQYVDSVATGLDTKDSVRVTTNGSSELSGFVYTASNDNETEGAAPWSSVTSPVFDSVTVLNGDRVLIKDSTDAKGNGLFTFDSGASTFVRTVDADNTPSNEVSGGMYCFIEEGTLFADTGWVLSSPESSATLGTDDLVFTQFSSAGVTVAGAGLTKTGTTIDVIGTTDRISVAADSIDIASGYVGQSSIITLGTVVNFTSTGIDDNASALSLSITDTSSAVNYIDITGGVTADGPTISSIGSDSDVDLNLVPKGTGNVVIGDSSVLAIIKSSDGVAGPGENLSIEAGDGDTNQDGGDLNLRGGTGNGTGVDGNVVIGDVNGPGGIKAANGAGGPGELLSLEGGDGDTNEDGGNLELKGGLGNGTGTGGEINLTAESGIRFVDAAFYDVTTLASGTSATPDFADSNFFGWSITGNATLNNPTNAPGAGSWYIYIFVDGSSRTLTLGGNLKEVVNSQGFTGTANKTYILRILTNDGTNFDVWIDERGV